MLNGHEPTVSRWFVRSSSDVRRYVLQWWRHPGPAGGSPGQPRVRGQHARQGQGRGQDHCAGGDHDKVMLLPFMMGPLCIL